MIGWQKPFRGIQLNRTHPLARGLKIAYVLNEGSGQHVTNYANPGILDLTQAQDANLPEWKGDGLYFSAADRGLINPNAVSPSIGTGPYTIFSGVTPFSGGATNGAILAFNDYYMWTIKNTGVLSGYQNWTGDSTGTVTFNEYNTIGWVKHSTDIDGSSYYINGLFDSTYRHTTSPDSLARVGIGTGRTSSTPYYCFLGHIHFIYLWDRDLTSKEIAYLNANPYCMFQRAVDVGVIGYVAAGGPAMPVFAYYHNQART